MEDENMIYVSVSQGARKTTINLPAPRFEIEKRLGSAGFGIFANHLQMPCGHGLDVEMKAEDDLGHAILDVLNQNDLNSHPITQINEVCEYIACLFPDEEYYALAEYIRQQQPNNIENLRTTALDYYDYRQPCLFRVTLDAGADSQELRLPTSGLRIWRALIQSGAGTQDAVPQEKISFKYESALPPGSVTWPESLSEINHLAHQLRPFFEQNRNLQIKVK